MVLNCNRHEKTDGESIKLTVRECQLKQRNGTIVYEWAPTVHNNNNVARRHRLAVGHPNTNERKKKRNQIKFCR